MYSSLPNRKQLIIVKNFKYFYNFHNIVVNFFQYVENLFIFIPLFVYVFELCIFYVAEYKITKNVFAISTYVYMVKVPFCYLQNVSFFSVKKTLKYTAIYLIDFKSILYLKKELLKKNFFNGLLLLYMVIESQTIQYMNKVNNKSIYI